MDSGGGMRREITLNLNGELKNFEADDTAPLLDVLRGAAGQCDDSAANTS